MRVPEQNLAIIDRYNPKTGEFELLVGVQQRGPWQNCLNFPGGKAGEDELPWDAVAREVAEETGILLPAHTFKLLGELVVVDKRPEIPTIGSVAILGAHLAEDMPLIGKADEFDPLWINPTDRNILLSMPRDVPFWLPLAFREPFQQFVCSRTIEENGGHSFDAALMLSDENFEPVHEFATNL